MSILNYFKRREPTSEYLERINKSNETSSNRQLTSTIVKCVVTKLKKCRINGWISTLSMVPLAPGLLKEEKNTFQRKIQELVTWHETPKELVINFD